MEPATIFEQLFSILTGAWSWFVGFILPLFSLDVFLQILVLLSLALLSHVITAHLVRRMASVAGRYPLWQKIRVYAKPLYRPGLALIFVFLTTAVGQALEYPVGVLDVAVNLLTAWIVIRLAANLIGNRSVAKFVAGLVWSIALLAAFNLLGPLVEILKSAAIPVGDTEVSAYDVIWGVASFVLLIWLAVFGSGLIETQLQKTAAITPSARVLLGKIVKIALVTFAFLVALNSTGIDLTALAVFSGALGVGLGFGLQKVVSNFISGVILLLDRSIKPGDVIEVQGTYGSINALAARYTSVITRDGTEYLIPNEDMITQAVINWSHSHSNVRRRVPLSVDYASDVRLAMEIMDTAAADNDRVLKIPKPATRLIGFGDNGVDLELRMWISDPQNGVRNVASEVMLTIWGRFKEEGIEFPYPQRVVRFADGHSPRLGAKGSAPD